MSSQAQSLVWLIKRVLQKLGVRTLRGSATPFAEPSSRNGPALAKLIAPSQSGLSRCLLAGMLTQFGAVARWRQRHQILWDLVLVSDEACRPGGVSAAERPVIREWTPYLGAYQVDSAVAQATYDKWQRLGLPVTTWPDLPPEVTGNQERHARALNFRHTRIYLPVHQSLNARTMLKQYRPSQPIAENEPCLRLVWDGTSPEQWQQWMAQSGRTNLLQSWAYGDAKSDESGWRATRGVFYRGIEPIAYVQVLQRRVAGVLLLSRINRGPLFLGPPRAQEQHAAWKALAGLGNLWLGRALSVAPELRLSGSNLAMMENLGFRQFSPHALESVWVDLGMDLVALRKNLDGKWRNMLSFSEKTNLRLGIASDVQSFDWMILQYQELMREKDFGGPPVSLLLALRKRLAADEPLIIMRAMHDEEAVAGICLVRHGSAATYLLGWNGRKGRNLKANQFLLWQATVHLKQLGLDWFDLGGLSEDHAPGIASFKLGMGGERYELVGEYWKW